MKYLVLIFIFTMTSAAFAAPLCDTSALHARIDHIIETEDDLDQADILIEEIEKSIRAIVVDCINANQEISEDDEEMKYEIIGEMIMALETEAEEEIARLETLIEKLYEQMDNTESDSEIARIEKRIESLEEKIELVYNKLDAEIEELENL